VADGYFGPPEAAALAGWSQAPKAGARVAQVTGRGRRAEVVVYLEPAYPDWVYSVHRAHGWRETVSGDGPTANWDDPNAYNWEL